MVASSPDDHRELPIACTLGAGDGPARLRRWQALMDEASAQVIRDGRTIRVRFQPLHGVFAELADLAAAEQECCSFVTWTVTDPDRPVLSVSANPDSPEDIDPIAALFGVR